MDSPGNQQCAIVSAHFRSLQTADSAPVLPTDGRYCKRTSFSCRTHDVMNIQHAHFGLVGPGSRARKVGLWVWVHWPATGIPTRRL